MQHLTRYSITYLHTKDSDNKRAATIQSTCFDYILDGLVVAHLDALVVPVVYLMRMHCSRANNIKVAATCVCEVLAHVNHLHCCTCITG